jgi:AraC-like DNA-binding protein
MESGRARAAVTQQAREVLCLEKRIRELPEKRLPDGDNTMIALPSVTHAFTDPVPPDERLFYWDSYNAASLVGLRTSSQAQPGLIASQTNAVLPTMRVAEIRGNAHAIERCPRMVDMYPKEAIFACHLVKGSASFVQGGVQLVANAGDTLIYDTRRPFRLAFPSDMQELLIDIPVTELDACWGIRVADLPLKIVPAGGVGAAMGAELRRTLKSFLRAPTIDGCLSLPACTHTVLRTMAQSRLRGAEAPHQSLFHILAAKMYIARHLGDPELCPADAAREAGISVRHLNRLFAMEGSSLSDYIWKQRTAMAYRDLVNVHSRGATIGEIAYRWGFSSQAHFCRAIGATYGAPPSALRKAPRPS